MTDYVPTTSEVETAFHEFASWLESTSPGEYAEAPEFADWQEAMHGFRRWLSQERARTQVEALREAALDDEATAAQLIHGMSDVFSGLSKERFMRRNEATELMRSGDRLRARADRIAREAGIDNNEGGGND